VSESHLEGATVTLAIPRRLPDSEICSSSDSRLETARSVPNSATTAQLAVYRGLRVTSQRWSPSVDSSAASSLNTYAADTFVAANFNTSCLRRSVRFPWRQTQLVGAIIRTGGITDADAAMVQMTRAHTVSYGGPHTYVCQPSQVPG